MPTHAHIALRVGWPANPQRFHKGNHMKMRTTFAVLASVLVSLPAHAAATDDGLIEGSYIVRLKEATASEPSLILPPTAKQGFASRNPPPFGEHGTGQSKTALAAALGTSGQVVSIYATINAAHIKMDADEAKRLRNHPQVLSVTQNRKVRLGTTQYNPGWGLDRLDSSVPGQNGQYTYSSTGAGQTVYVLDSGLDLSNSAVAAEFGGRASIIYDVNGGNGADCHGHGTAVASIIGGNTNGVAKGVNLAIAKITDQCTRITNTDTWAMAFDWLAQYAPRGTIVNLSAGIELSSNGTPVCTSAPIFSGPLQTIYPDVEDAIRAAYNAGIIVVISAGNDGCNTAYYTPTRQPESFVVGATDNSRFTNVPPQDAKASYSRTGSNISTFAPGTNVNVLYYTGQQATWTGTSFAAPYISGIFAIACQAVAPYCATTSTEQIYTALTH